MLMGAKRSKQPGLVFIWVAISFTAIRWQQTANPSTFLPSSGLLEFCNLDILVLRTRTIQNC